MSSASMPSLLIRNIPVQTMARLKARAKRAHRSVEAEARTMVLEYVEKITMQEWIKKTVKLREELRTYQQERGIQPLDVVATLRRDRRSH